VIGHTDRRDHRHKQLSGRRKVKEGESPYGSASGPPPGVKPTSAWASKQVGKVRLVLNAGHTGKKVVAGAGFEPATSGP